MTRKAAVVGWPIEHSLSPLLHGYWLKQYGIDGRYERIAIAPGSFAQQIAALREAGYRGVNVTVPYKQDAFALAHNKDHSAIEAGAANLLVFRADGVEAHNTDTIGLSESLRAHIDLDGKSVVLLGAGGAARGAVLALHRLGAKTIHILNRSVSKARALAGDLHSIPADKLVTGELADWAAVSGDAALAINATSAGMGGNPPLDIDLSVLPNTAAVCDIVYSPLETPLLKAAATRGLKTIDGLGMLMHQAAPSFEAFFGVRPQVTQGLRDELVRALNAR